MILIKKSSTADTRTCDFKNVTKDQLKNSSIQHIEDVAKALGYFKNKITVAEKQHDIDKITGLDHFHQDFITGFKQTNWWDNHRRISRHHLLQNDGIPADVNLIDVLELIADCVMAGIGRSGNVYSIKIDPNVLKEAFDNTVELLKSQITLDKEKK